MQAVPDKPHAQILGAVRSAPEFANNNAKVKEALTATKVDSCENSAVVNADGASDSSVKADSSLQ